jgi:hypothetical protein
LPLTTGYDGASTDLWGPQAVTGAFAVDIDPNTGGSRSLLCWGYEKIGIELKLNNNGAPALATLRLRVLFDYDNAPPCYDGILVTTVVGAVASSVFVPRQFVLTVATDDTARFEVDTQGAYSFSIQVEGDVNSVGSSAVASVVRFSTGRPPQ